MVESGRAPVLNFVGAWTGSIWLGKSSVPIGHCKVIDLIYQRYQDRAGIRPISLLAAVNGCDQRRPLYAVAL